MKPDAIVFDLDGTLIDSAPDMRSAVNKALGVMGRPALDLATVIGFIGNGVEKLVARSLKATGGSDPHAQAQAVALFMQAYDKDSVSQTRPFDGVEACLTRLADLHIPLAICTNKPEHAAQEICSALGMHQYFKIIAGALPGRPKKPDPAPLLAVLDNLGVAPGQALYVGDSAVDHETALRAGVPFRLFQGGYLNTPLPDLQPDAQFDNWDDVRFAL